MAGKNEKTEIVKFSKEQILQSNKYRSQQDVLNAVLDDGDYTVEEVDKKIERFMKGKVK